MFGPGSGKNIWIITGSGSATLLQSYKVFFALNSGWCRFFSTQSSHFVSRLLNSFAQTANHMLVLFILLFFRHCGLIILMTLCPIKIILHAVVFSHYRADRFLYRNTPSCEWTVYVRITNTTFSSVILLLICGSLTVFF